MTIHDVEFYMKLKYLETVTEEEGTFFATISDLPGLMAEGKTLQEAMHNLQTAKRDWFKAALASGFPIPFPSPR